MTYLKSMLWGLAVLGYGTSFGMLQVRNNKPTSKSTKSVEVAQMYRSLKDKPKSEILLLKDHGDASRDNVFTYLPKELRLLCCSEGEDYTKKPFVNQRIQNFRWYLRLEDRLNLSCASKSLRNTLLSDDPNLGWYLQEMKIQRHPVLISGNKIFYERGVKDEIGFVIGSPYKVETANNCIIS